MRNHNHHYHQNGYGDGANHQPPQSLDVVVVTTRESGSPQCRASSGAPCPLKVSSSYLSQPPTAQVGHMGPTLP